MRHRRDRAVQRGLAQPGIRRGGELLTKGAGIPQDSLENRVLFHTDKDQRFYLTEEIHKMGTVNPQPNHNWKFVPEEWTKPALERDRKLLFGE